MESIGSKKTVLIYEFSGSVSYYGSYNQFNKIDKEVKIYPPKIVAIDLTEATEINAQALGYFVDLKNRCDKHQIILAMYPSRAVEKILSLMNLKTFFGV